MGILITPSSLPEHEDTPLTASASWPSSSSSTIPPLRSDSNEGLVCLAAWGPTVGGTAASFGVYAFALSLGPTVIIDSIRTSMWYQEVFGSA